jgi:hypothetical protein
MDFVDKNRHTLHTKIEEVRGKGNESQRPCSRYNYFFVKCCSGARLRRSERRNPIPGTDASAGRRVGHVDDICEPRSQES